MSIVVVESALVPKADGKQSVVSVVWVVSGIVVGMLLGDVVDGGVIWVVGVVGGVDGVDVVGMVVNEVDELGVEVVEDEGVVMMVVGDCVGWHVITWLVP